MANTTSNFTIENTKRKGGKRQHELISTQFLIQRHLRAIRASQAYSLVEPRNSTNKFIMIY